MIPVDKYKIREKLENKNMTDADLAVKLGITPATYSRYMSGQIVLTLPTFVSMLNILEVRDDEISSFLLR